ncbi:MAG: S-adenosylmethionine decarboxylase [Candidatus Aenigmarchaeota archaeon]|nr:S-adenosylmethionine decarboxylase [Candidatus Aenigmarchaeota archaeon]
MRRRRKFPLLLVALYGCNSDKLDNADHLKAYTREICAEIGMKRCGRPIVTRRYNGQLSGLSAGQIIETSHIIVHCHPAYQFALIDIFSCKEFDQQRASEFSKNYFGALSYTSVSRRI